METHISNLYHLLHMLCHLLGLWARSFAVHM